jgi:DNA-binding transcriptional LysR family regulator
MLVNGELDLALIRGDREHEQIRHTLLAEDQIAACVPINHPFAKRESISLEELCQQPLVLFKNGYFLRETVNSYCQQYKVQPNIHFETNLPELLKSMVRRQIGIGTCLPILVADEPELKAIPFNPPIPLQLGIGWKSSHYLSTAAKAFVSFLQGTLRDQH